MKVISYKHNTVNIAVTYQLPFSTSSAQSLGSSLMKTYADNQSNTPSKCHQHDSTLYLRIEVVQSLALLNLHSIENFQQLQSCHLFLHPTPDTSIVQLQARALASGNFLSDPDIFMLAGSALLTTNTLEQQTTRTNRLLSECTAVELKSPDPF